VNSTYNNHHTLFTRRAYQRTREPYLLRNHPAMIHRLPIVDHNQLHANIEPLPVISTLLARFALQYLDEQSSSASGIERFVRLTSKLDTISRATGRVALEAGMFSEHFDEQLNFMDRVKPNGI